MEYQTLVVITTVSIGGIFTVEPAIRPYYNLSAETIQTANEVKFNPNIKLVEDDEDFVAIVVTSPGKAIGKNNGNNGHGNDADGNDDSNPGNSNDPYDYTDDDGAPGKHLQTEDDEIHFACFDEGLVAAGHVKLQNLNNFGAGFCLHGDKSVKLGNQNAFTQGSVVSSNQLHKVESGEQTTGLQDALTIAHLGINIPDTIENVKQDLLDPTRAARPSYLNTNPSQELPNSVLSQNTLKSGNVYTYLCRGNDIITTHKNLRSIENVAIITDCPIAFSDNTEIKNSVIISTSKSKNAITTGIFTLGENDNCTQGGGAQLLTHGGINFTDYSEFHGSHIIAERNITMTQAKGIGALVLAGQSVTGQSTTMYACGSADNTQENFSIWQILINMFS